MPSVNVKLYSTDMINDVDWGPGPLPSALAIHLAMLFPKFGLVTSDQDFCLTRIFEFQLFNLVVM